MYSKWQIAVAVIALAWTVNSLHAQEMGRFQWHRGQMLDYQVEQTTVAVDSTSKAKNEVRSLVQQTKRWQVLDVDAAGVATVQLSLTRLMMEQHLPNGDVWQYDSSAPERGHKQLAQQFGPLVNKPLAVLRVDSTGKVLEVKSTVQGATSRFEAELPFIVTLPGAAMHGGQTWSRGYHIVLDPPIGTGEKFAAEQHYQVKSFINGEAKIEFSTTIKELPKIASDRLPLLQLQPRGTVTFDARRGLMTNAHVASSGVVEGHQGEGSRYEFKSEYREQLVP